MYGEIASFDARARASLIRRGLHVTGINAQARLVVHVVVCCRGRGPLGWRVRSAGIRPGSWEVLIGLYEVHVTGVNSTHASVAALFDIRYYGQRPQVNGMVSVHSFKVFF